MKKKLLVSVGLLGVLAAALIVVLLGVSTTVSLFAGGDRDEGDWQEVLRGDSPRLISSDSDSGDLDRRMARQERLAARMDRMVARGILVTSSSGSIDEEDVCYRLLPSFSDDADISELGSGTSDVCQPHAGSALLGWPHWWVPSHWDELSYRLIVARQPSQVIETWPDRDQIREVEALKGVLLDPQKHPEGDAYVHTLLAVDAAAQLDCGDRNEQRLMLLAALCHDLGKAETMQLIDGELMAPGHAARGVKRARALLKRFGVSTRLIKQLCELVRYHSAVHDMPRDATAYAYRELAWSFETITLPMLVTLVLCDLRAVSTTGEPREERRFALLDRFVEGARKAGVWE